ncbi:hypothetical protein C9383_09375 [Pseudomonas palleroniana]|uniref:Thymidylate synthase n=1 Tax=Pseudomonas palleroniana TaxID=191390 RepID=A0A1H5KMF3_9PSED|nr:hypothetical protein [Pseudomonas palleroniana]KAB0568424.1 hypothetical protein F7R03_07465 [Pseudomonas palleroniana]PTC28740.1 hypothetical protein C9383_09375 [Pseudomonas palleroniana]SEE66049.1 hypothetical protein SAMN04490198_2296 [Pseudomonas palleroniana]
MTEVFRRSRVVQGWLAGIRYLASQKSHDSTNVIIEIATPQSATEEDREVIKAVDLALQRKNAQRSVMTAAGTIFPQRIYQRYGRPDWYARYKTVIARGMPSGDWGTYALRMIDRKQDDGTTFNPLDKIIEKLIAVKGKQHFKATYELGVCDPSVDIENAFNGIGFELPTYNPAVDRHMYMGSPCLSHVTFKLMDGKLDLTAIYRSHYYAERALGNLLGLAQLQQYVATESGFEPGKMTCVSTYAKLDPGLGGIRPARKLLETLPIDETLIKASLEAVL